jgi:cation:H+ antiporter
VSLGAAFDGNADISIANVVGSNIFNILFILGISALIRPLVIHSQMISREVPIMIVVSILFLLVALDGTISRLEGGFLFLCVLSYTFWLVREALQKKRENAELARESEQEFGALKKTGSSIWTAVLLVVVGLGIVMLGAEWLIEGAILTAKSFGVSDAVVGLTIVAAGTSLPEVVASIMATLKGERDIAIGNVVGSNIYNILAILGLTGLIVPQGLVVSADMLRIDIPIMIVVAMVCWPFFRSGKELSRVEGAIFLIAYVAYTAFLIQRSGGI